MGTCVFVELTFIVWCAIVCGCFGIGAFVVKIILFSVLMETDKLMEGLVGSQMTPITAHCKQLSSPFLPVFSPRFTKKFNLSLIGMSKSPKSLNLIAASVQPLESAKLGHFNNTLPSKG